MPKIVIECADPNDLAAIESATEQIQVRISRGIITQFQSLKERIS